MEVYVNDSIVKSKEDKNHVANLAETFTALRKHQMKVNPKKCVFGVKSGKLFGFMVSKRGIDANPAKVQAMLDLPELRTKRDVQRLTGRMTALSRLAKWAFELTEFSISNQLRTAIKAQALADFLTECSYQETLDEEKKIWTVFTDGSSTVNGSGAGVVITSPEGKSFEYALKFSFNASNNEAEYEAAIAGLELCIALEAELKNHWNPWRVHLCKCIYSEPKVST
ncbi:uncharacterized protein LOC110725102 [Chenopodium quinoa]|uniref:uncharacterized protein LOC110725102 n=1 Tax=Chenopodium quinoa TaxID=63459 RepID=UPI000B78B5E2|nr:uncharacterized protein LOC110725102 [Chenopodium quinoa]